MKLDRRTWLKGLLAASGALVVAPLAKLGDFLNPPSKFEPRRMKIEGARSMRSNTAIFFSWPTDIRPFDSNILVMDDRGNYHAYNRICTHLQCLVNYDPQTKRIVCPCHGSSYDVLTGAVLGGPAPRGLPKILLESDEAGDVYAVNAEGVFGYGR